ncbi:MAG: hypothetical protein BWY63_03714 [Chloroflexi bacterium ADurb.Bin360]|nr:MAG: hypothetical protein BWY63_03714 [Chloroflexi bacterium ADurb.Bin360]
MWFDPIHVTDILCSKGAIITPHILKIKVHRRVGIEYATSMRVETREAPDALILAEEFDNGWSDGQWGRISLRVEAPTEAEQVYYEHHKG